MQQPGLVQYEAFISYRHNPRDIAVAKALVRQLEGFRVPAKLQGSAGRKKLNKLFRDREELPLSDDLEQSIKTAIERSRWLIVICSPTLKDSKWCLKEIDYFIACHGRQRVLTVLTEGKPGQSFPPALLAGGSEPLAADVCARTTAGALRKLRTEKLRLLAPMLGVGFDDLYKRYQRRRIRVIAGVSATVAAVSAAFAGMAIYQARQIEAQRVRAVQNEIGLLAGRSLIATGADDRLLGARYALEAYDRYTALYPEGEPALAADIQTSLEAAAYTQGFQTLSVMKHGGRYIHSLCYAPDDRYILGIIGGNAAALLDAQSGELLATVSDSVEAVDTVAFSPDGQYFLSACYWEGSVTVWRTGAAPEKVARFAIETGQAQNLRGAAFLANSEILLAAPNGLGEAGDSAATPQLLVWDFLKDEKRELAGAKQLANTMLTEAPVVSADGAWVAVPADFAADIAVWSLRHGWRELPAEGMVYRRFGFSPDGTLLAGAASGRLTVWELPGGQVRFQREIAEEPPSAVPLFSPEGGLVVFDGTVWDAQTGAERYRLREDPSSVTAGAQFSPDGRYLATVSDHAVIYDATDGTLLSTLGDAQITSLAFRHDSRYLVTNSIAGTAALHGTPAVATAALATAFEQPLYVQPRWSTNDQYPTMTLQQRHFYSPQFYAAQERLFTDPTARYIARACGDGFIEVWDRAQDGIWPRYGISEHWGAISDVLLTEAALVSGGQDGKVLIFDLVSGQMRYVLPVGEGVARVECDPAGRLVLALPGSGAYAMVYNVQTGKALYRLEAEPGQRIVDIGFTEDGGQAVAVQQNGQAVVGELLGTLDALRARAEELLQ